MTVAISVDVAAAIAAACRATGVADVAGVDQTTWAASWEDGGHVRAWRPGRVARGRCPYLEYRVREVTFDDRTALGGTATVRVEVAAVVREGNHGNADDLTAALILTAMDAFRMIPGAICGSGDSIGEAVAVAGFSDVWRREGEITLALSYGEGQRGGPTGTVTFPPIGGGTTGGAPGVVTAVAWNEAGSPRTLLTIPSGFVIDHVVVVITETWDGVGASVSLGYDGDPSALLVVNAPGDLIAGESTRLATPISGASQVIAAWSPGAGATGGRATLQVATAPE